MTEGCHKKSEIKSLQKREVECAFPRENLREWKTKSIKSGWKQLVLEDSAIQWRKAKGVDFL